MKINHKKVTGIVLAAGRGSRMHSSVQKQYMLLEGYPLVYYALKSFQNSEVDDIVLVAGADEIEYCEQEIVKAFDFTKVKKVIAGGAERYESVYNALSAVEDADYVMIHDGARPFITEEMIHTSIVHVKQHGACSVAVPTKDTIKEVSEKGFGIRTLDRSCLWNIQTPQTFERELLKKAYLKMLGNGDTDITDDTMIVERYMGHSVKIIMGSYENLKITTPEDMKIAEFIMKNQEEE